MYVCVRVVFIFLKSSRIFSFLLLKYEYVYGGSMLLNLFHVLVDTLLFGNHS